MTRKIFTFFIMLQLILSVSANQAEACYGNCTTGGQISGNQSGCVGFDPATIGNAQSPGGGWGTLQIIWKKKSASTGNAYQVIQGATGLTYDPGPLTETTRYKRYARRYPCTDYEYSNEVCITINNCCNANLTSLNFYNLSNGSVQAISNNGNYSLTSLPSSFNIQANVTGTTVGSVKLTISGPVNATYTDNTSPFRFPNNTTALNLTAGNYTVVVKVYNAANATGTVCDEETFCFTITNNACPYNYAISNYNVMGNIIYPLNGIGAPDGNGVKFNRGDNGSYTRVVWDMGQNIPAGTLVCARIKLEHCVNSSQGISKFKFWIAPAGTPANGTYISQSNTISLSNTSYQLFCFTTTQTCRYVKISDEKGCAFKVDNIEWQNCPPPSVTINVNKGKCELNNGSATAVASSGTPPYSYLWSNGATSATINNLAAGSYTVTVTDANNKTASATANVTNSGKPVATATITQPINCNAGVGTASVTATGGTAPYSNLWSNGSVNQTIGNLISGTYTVTVTDHEGCKSTDVVTLAEPSKLNANIKASTDVKCFGGNNGMAEVWATGGTAPYSYLWSNGATSVIINNLSAGSYTATVTDAKGCKATVTATINQPSSALSAIVSSVNALCSDADGSLDVTVTGGTAPYTYLWNNGATTAHVDNVLPGSYSVVVTDANNCTATGTAIISKPSVLNVNIKSSEDVKCYGDFTGMAEAWATGGTSPYSYEWSNGSTSRIISNLAAGTYTVTVTDANGCKDEVSVTIGQPDYALEALASSVNALCNDSDGSLDVTVTGGTAPYSYLWNNGANTAHVDNVLPGTYSVVVTDANGCTTNSSAEITKPDALNVNIKSSENVKCYGESTGMAEAWVTGGTSPYSYLWNTGATSRIINNLAAGTYTVTVTDANGCSGLVSVVIEQPLDILDLAVISKSHVNCHGDATGSASVSATGGTQPYNYMWSNGETTASVTGLAAGVYTVTVTDVNGCTDLVSFSILEPKDPLLATATGSNAYCNNANGSIHAEANGGTAPYSFVWNIGNTDADVLNVLPGNYYVTVTDAKGCTATATAMVENINSVVTADAYVIQQITVHGGNNGAAGVNASGGSGVYAYLWSNGSSVSEIFDLVAGTYTVTVTDENGCYASDDVVLEQPDKLEIKVSGNGTTCGLNNGSATLQVTGGVAPYTYLWSNLSTDDHINNVAAGLYTVTVTDANGATDSDVVEILSSSAPTVAVLITQPILCQGEKGSLEAVAIGGTAPYTYLWNTGDITSILTGVDAGTYSVVVTDYLGCTAQNKKYITSPKKLVLGCTKNNVSCNKGNDGSACAVATGGTLPYSYLWNTGDTTDCIINLTYGTYSVTVTDANGCTAVKSVTLSQPAKLKVTLTVTDAVPAGSSTGSILSVVTGGVAPYTYLWNNGSTTASITGLNAGLYSVTITDSKGCIVEATATVNEEVVIYCDGFRTETPQSFAGTPSGNNAAAYLLNNFANVYPNGVVIGSLCSNGNTITITSANAARLFLNPNTVGNPVLTASYVDPLAADLPNALAALTLALRLNLDFDQADANYAASSFLLKDMIVDAGPFAGYTVQQVYEVAENYLGGCGSAFTGNVIRTALNNICQFWRGGKAGNTYLVCPQVTLRVLHTEGKIQEAVAINAYPNPANDYFTLELKNIINEITSVTVSDIAGRVMFSTNVSGEYLELNSTDWNNGIYLVNVKNGTFNQTLKVVVKH